MASSFRDSSYSNGNKHFNRPPLGALSSSLQASNFSADLRLSHSACSTSARVKGPKRRVYSSGSINRSDLCTDFKRSSCSNDICRDCCAKRQAARQTQQIWEYVATRPDGVKVNTNSIVAMLQSMNGKYGHLDSFQPWGDWEIMHFPRKIRCFDYGMCTQSHHSCAVICLTLRPILHYWRYISEC